MSKLVEEYYKGWNLFKPGDVTAMETRSLFVMMRLSVNSLFVMKASQVTFLTCMLRCL